MPLYGGASGGTYRQYADRAAFDVSAITVACWIKYVTAGAVTTNAISRGIGNTAEGDWRLGLSGGGAPLFNVRYSSAAHAATAASAPVPGTWNHYIGRYVPADSQVRQYINGVLDGTAVGGGAIPAGTQNVRIFESTDGGNHANVVLALFGFWNVGLDDNERAALVAGANPATIRPDALVICDQLDSRTSFDTAGMEAPTDVGNIVAMPRDFPYRRGRLKPAPGPRNISSRRRALPTAGGVTGTGSVTTATETASGAGRVIHKATGAVTTATVTASGAGVLDHSGTGAATTSNVTASGSGVVEHSGSGAVTTGAATASGAGKVVHPGSGSVTTGTTTASGAGRLVHVTTGAPGVTTGNVTASGAGITVGTQTGTGSVTTGAATATGAGRVVHRGSGGVTTGAVTAEGVGVGPGGVSGAGSGRRKTPKPRRPLKEAAPPVKARRPRFLVERPPQAPQPAPAFDFEADDEAAMLAILEAVL